MKLFKSTTRRRLAVGAAVAAPLAMLAAPLMANHSWSTYHWKRTTAELTVPVGDNVSSTWDSALATAVSDWNKSTVIQSPLVPGTTNPRNCKAIAGTIQVCNGSYGNTGWLGIASISLSGGHISQGTTKLNDTYFNTAKYNTPAWRALVTCQEVGHDYGLDHQDEAFDNPNLGTCMDYTNDPSTNQHPNAHDYEQLLTIYNHLEAAFGIAGNGQAAAGADVGDTPAEWGRAVRFDRYGRPTHFERVDGPGRVTLTHVFWAIGEGPRRGAD
jgi:hypothetical protein